ncbi:MAG: N4-(beta-N-acetylglucosaminyl)-L-asparaginase, partial [Psychroserpens sp.]
MKRRHFIKNATLSGAGLALASSLVGCAEQSSEEKNNAAVIASDTATAKLPMVIATWHVINATA